MSFFAKIFLSACLLCSFSVLSACGSVDVHSEQPSSFTDVRTTPTPEPASAVESLKIAAVGDIMLGSPFPNDSRMPPNDGADLLKDVTPLLSAADLAFGNLEGPMTDGGQSSKCRTPKPGEPIRCFAFRMPTRYGKYLKEAGFDVMSVANNHAGDFGSLGRLSTRKTLDDLDIKHAGSENGTLSTAFIEVKGVKIAVIGFATNAISPNVNNLSIAQNLVTAADKKADIVIVSFHGGAEGTDSQHVPNKTELFFGEKRGNLPAFSRAVIDAGADLVIGHGPHVLRGMEIYKDRLIAYSLGNFATYGWFRLEAETALTTVLEVNIDKDGKFIGGMINAAKLEGRGIPMLDSSGESIRKIRSLSETDFGVNAPKIADDGSFVKK